jgi:septal ring factor EnvC (AmiA/AmiB activator)
MADASETVSAPATIAAEDLVKNSRHLMDAARRQREALADQVMLVSAEASMLRENLGAMAGASEAVAAELRNMIDENHLLTQRLQAAHDELAALKAQAAANDRSAE